MQYGPSKTNPTKMYLGSLTHPHHFSQGFHYSSNGCDLIILSQFGKEESKLKCEEFAWLSSFNLLILHTVFNTKKIPKYLHTWTLKCFYQRKNWPSFLNFYVTSFDIKMHYGGAIWQLHWKIAAGRFEVIWVQCVQHIIPLSLIRLYERTLCSCNFAWYVSWSAL